MDRKGLMTLHAPQARSSLQRGRLMPTATMNQTEETYSGDSYWYHEDILNVTVSNSTSVFQSPLSPLVDKAISCITIIILFITMVSLGCTMEISKIKAHILKPKGVAIAVVAQYGIMPLTAFTLAKVFQLGSIESVTVLICGCCPGGNLSNIFALALKGDMNLRACVVLGVVFILSSMCIVGKAIHDLATKLLPEVGDFLFSVSILSGILCIILAVVKFMLGRVLTSRALITDAFNSLVGGIMGFSILISAEVFKHNPNVWYLDGMTGVLIGLIILAYGVKLLIDMVPRVRQTHSYETFE
ncbi:UNVERIFIED_CONTAM: hypothetical protein FKN15_035994 [Acipenser sinensis]